VPGAMEACVARIAVGAGAALEVTTV
jgi:hypothetical protein